MFDYIRQHTRIALLVVVLLIIPSFVFFGIEGYSGFTQARQPVATVDGREISRMEWEAAHRQEVDRLRQQMPGLDVRIFDTPQMRMATLNRLVQDRVLLAASQAMHLVPSNQTLQRELLSLPVIESLRRADGSIDVQQYRELLAAQGLTPETFEADLRRRLALQQVVAGVASTSFTAQAVSSAAMGTFLQRREIQVARYETASFKPQVQVTDAEIEAHYRGNQERYLSPETVAIQYLELDLDTMAARVTLPEAEVRSYYDQNAGLYTTPEQRRTRHILITAERGAPASEREQARTQLAQLLAQLRDDPSRFEELARAHSQDPGSAQQGGDLDYISRGAMVAPFEQAAFALKPGEISEIVETEFGYHLIQVVDVRGGERRPYEAVREEIAAGLRQQLAQREFAQAAETFTNTVYEQSDSLEPAAQALKLEIRTAQDVTRQPAGDAQGALANPRFLAALFAQDVLRDKRNTEAVEVGPNRLAAARITAYSPARTRPLEEVREAIREELVTRKAADLARQAGERDLAAWRQDAAQAQLPEKIVVSRDDPAGVPSQVLRAVLQADAAQLPAWVGVDLEGEGYAVVRVNAVTAPEEIPPQARTEYSTAWANAQSLAYIETLKRRYKAKVTVTPSELGEEQN